MSIYTRKDVLLLASSVSRPVSEVVSMLKNLGETVELGRGSRDLSPRGMGNASNRRQGIVRDPFLERCYCDYSPCSHEWEIEADSYRREERAKLRGVRKVKGAK